jgi:hypothetical protein
MKSNAAIGSSLRTLPGNGLKTLSQILERFTPERKKS